MINKTLARRWVKALRSGKYDQTTGSLQTGNGYCCLGVLCDLAPKSVGNWAEDANKFAFVTKEEEERIMPPKAVLKWIGLRFASAERLAEANDEGATFDEIADRIEKNFKLKEKTA